MESEVGRGECEKVNIGALQGARMQQHVRLGLFGDCRACRGRPHPRPSLFAIRDSLAFTSKPPSFVTGFFAYPHPLTHFGRSLSSSEHKVWGIIVVAYIGKVPGRYNDGGLETIYE